MAAIDFPNSPAVNDTFTIAGKTWIWTGDVWNIVSSAANGTLNDLTDVTITTPSDGDVLTYDNGTGEWVNAVPTGGGTPGGSDTQVQYNNAGAFAGITGATTDGTNLSVTTPSSANHAANKSYVDTVVVSESEYAKIQAIWYHLNSF